MYLKQKWYAAEQLVKKRYIDQGYTAIIDNFTIRGGEIDLIMTHGDVLHFVEVKVVDTIDHLHDFITPRKLAALHRTIQTFCMQYEGDRESSLDVVFVQHGHIVEHFFNITL